MPEFEALGGRLPVNPLEAIVAQEVTYREPTHRSGGEVRQPRAVPVEHAGAVDAEQPLIGARHGKVVCAYVHGHHAQRLGHVCQEQRAAGVSGLGDGVEIEPQAGEVAYVAHRHEACAFIDLRNNLLRRELPVPAADQAHLDAVLLHLDPGQYRAGETPGRWSRCCRRV